MKKIFVLFMVICAIFSAVTVSAIVCSTDSDCATDYMCESGYCIPITSDNCTDNDGDGYGVGPDCLGLDCNDNNQMSWVGQECYRDDDGDQYNHMYGYDDTGIFRWCGDGTPHEICNLNLYPYTDQYPQGPDFCDDNENAHTEIDCNPSNDVPEFGIIGALVALGGAGFVMYRKRK